jgi:hypothetical protein
MKEWLTVLRAADAAARWLVNQRRKGSAQEPYINHLLEVASLVAEATQGKDPDLVNGLIQRPLRREAQLRRSHESIGPFDPRNIVGMRQSQMTTRCDRS